MWMWARLREGKREKCELIWPLLAALITVWISRRVKIGSGVRRDDEDRAVAIFESIEGAIWRA